ncbi:hypothetical protein L226DRAFT_521232 [Lentinus tigrinus ALCF2SS1-7]|uniref:DUF6699 domain-containing protein n=1 Tax=Lentinus tigrinus ALCF2SS1-6 TaxID=1328759 RepID=A0A5C2SHL7_9APHY|nr:hypothetical protein L227DRAFT_430734 [Lentinus tigrinus ALCF2SS1-6]RPD77643.1 hypothetical protein L226DRAFT_521232 [Lentinus tigrinus ALCF2SS1-7]
MPFFTKKKNDGAVNTPPAPKYKPLDLPAFGEGEPDIPPLAPSWASSDSSGSSVASSVPSTPASSPAPWRRPFTPHRTPAARSQTPQEMPAPEWHVSQPEPEVSLYRKALTPSPEIFKPRPRRAASAHQPSPVQVMQGLVSSTPMPMSATQRPLKSILKQKPTVPRSAASTPAPTVRTKEIRLHWQLCPPASYRTARTLEVEFDLRKPVEDIVIRDFARLFPFKLSQSDVDQYLDRKVCEFPPLRKMDIHYSAFPQWKVTVKRDDGDVLRVRDVFKALYEDLQKRMTLQERSAAMPTQAKIDAVADAFIERCNASTRTVPWVEQKVGLRRVDLLTGDSFFMGLTRPEKDDQDFWVAHFGAGRRPGSPI